MAIQENIDQRRAAEKLIKAIGELVWAEVKQLTPAGKTIFWNELHKITCKFATNATPVSAASQAPPPSKSVEDWREAVVQGNRIRAKVEAITEDLDLCERGADEYAVSVGRKSTNIAISIQQRRRVSTKQQAALDNMEAGLDNWLGEAAFEYSHANYPDEINPELAEEEDDGGGWGVKKTDARSQPNASPNRRATTFMPPTDDEIPF
jgi:hypothetical protein